VANNTSLTVMDLLLASEAQALVSLARKPALNSGGMFCEPLTHLLIGPSPFKGVGVAVVVFGPGSQNMGLKLYLALPRRPFQVIMLERMDEDFRLVQPRGIGGRVPRFPPARLSAKCARVLAAM